MHQPNQLAIRIWNAFAVSKPALRASYQANKTIQDKLEIFSPFVMGHTIRAEKYIRDFQKAFATEPDEEDGFNKVLDIFEMELEKENPDLLFYCLECFLSGYRGKLKFVIPPLVVREPEMVIPSPGKITLKIAKDAPEESEMDWFREDPSLNEHHAHWHVVYNPRFPKDRQGEMFFYMHQQMLARYDADRLATGVKRVEPADNLKDRAIYAGYAAGEDVRLSQLPGFRERNGKEKALVEDGEALLDDLKSIKQDIDNNYYALSHPQKPAAEIAAVDQLGSTIEYNARYDSSRPYVSYHGAGHNAIGKINNGVMFYPVAAIRDVVFWEWHKGVDNIYFALQQKFEPTDFTLNDPKITMRKMVRGNNEPYSADLILCIAKDIPGDAAKTGEYAFGGHQWEKDFEAGSFTYDSPEGSKTIQTVKTLQTYKDRAAITYPNPDGSSETYYYPYLSHIPFTYYIRVENKNLQKKLLTLRIFMVPTELMEDRRAWIEMDKFTASIDGNTRKVICRQDRESSVVKKPADPNPPDNNRDFDPVNLPLDGEQCSCGWPYRMLLPMGKSTDGGMDFTLMVMITDGEIDGLGKESDCGSLSFCAARYDAYPDKLPLGFPFNRNFAGNGNAIRQFLNGNKYVISRIVKIQHEPLNG